ncbi:MAG TPA: hypothetical protein VJS43_08115, partial [Candidatus Acidoferrales bacterium]|nr:hypothetical protein [Candidatus Acidoferrales bacterium]
MKLEVGTASSLTAFTIDQKPATAGRPAAGKLGDADWLPILERRAGWGSSVLSELAARIHRHDDNTLVTRKQGLFSEF